MYYVDPLTLRKGVSDFDAKVCVNGLNYIAGLRANGISISSEGSKCPHNIVIDMRNVHAHQI